jgi:hypothetical protein
VSIGIAVHIDDAAVAALINDPLGPVGLLIAELSEQAAAVSRAVVHVRPGTPRSTVWGPRSTTRPPGFTKASIHTHGPVVGVHGLYGGVNAAADPGIFLEYLPHTEQYYGPYPFLTVGLDSLIGTL